MIKILPFDDGRLPLAIVLGSAQDGHSGGEQHHILFLLPCIKKNMRNILFIRFKTQKL